MTVVQQIDDKESDGIRFYLFIWWSSVVQMNKISPVPHPCARLDLEIAPIHDRPCLRRRNGRRRPNSNAWRATKCCFGEWGFKQNQKKTLPKKLGCLQFVKMQWKSVVLFVGILNFIVCGLFIEVTKTKYPCRSFGTVDAGNDVIFLGHKTLVVGVT